MNSRKWPHPDYMLNRWPASISFFENRLSTPANRQAITSALSWAGMPQTKRGFKAIGVREAAVRRLIKMAAQNRHSNKYHDPAHTLSVIRAAGLIGAAAGLSAQHRTILILAALVHDLDHQGLYARTGYAAQEILSFHLVQRVLSRYGVHMQVLHQIKDLLLATYPDAPVEAEPRSGSIGHMIECLVDADLFQSLFTRHDIVDSLTAKLKHEMKLSVPHQTLLQQFLTARRRVGLQSAGGRWLHGKLPEGYTYFNSRNGQF